MTLRDVARSAVREEVLRQAWLLFAERGFEATTVDQIAAAAGMSRRTFFRYFGGKDELVLVRLADAGERIAAALAARPSDESAWVALRRAFDEVVTPQDEKAAQSRALLRMLRDEPDLRGTVTERRRLWQDLLAPIVAQRRAGAGRPDAARGADAAGGAGASGRATGSGEPELGAAALSACALTCLEAAQERWADDDRATLADLLDGAMAAVSPLR